MKKFVAHIGLMLIVAGTLVLAVTRVQSLNGSNGLLAAGLLCIVTGIVLHVRSIKRESRY